VVHTDCQQADTMHPQLKRGNRLPSLPTVAVEILRLFNLPDSSIEEVTQTIQTDPALAIKVLKAVNSTRFGARQEITDLRVGITRLGQNRITPLVLSFSLASTSLETGDAAEFYKEIWLRSYVQATAAEIVAEPHGAAVAAECFTINLLAGIGKLAMLKADVELYRQCRAESAESGQPFSGVAAKLYGISPRELSIDILSDVGLPERFITAVRLLEPNATDGEISTDDQRLVQVTRTAEAVGSYLCDQDSALALLTLEELISGTKHTVDRLLDAIHLRLEESAALFNVDPTQIPPQEELLEAALEQLADFTSLVGTEKHDQVPAALLEENGRLKCRVQDLIKETSVDALTGVFNRNWLNAKMNEVQAVSRLHNAEFGIAVIDIDHFKDVNDRHGHRAGDAVLREVAQALSSVTRKDETIARYGGEEFVLLLEHASHQGMEAVGEQLRSTVENTSIDFEGTPIPVTVSIGIAHGMPLENNDFCKEVFARADAALYEAKHNGRNRVVLDSSLAAPPNEVAERMPATTGLTAATSSRQ
jgi:two-component system cell cycle response regulator